MDKAALAVPGSHALVIRVSDQSPACSHGKPQLQPPSKQHAVINTSPAAPGGVAACRPPQPTLLSVGRPLLPPPHSRCCRLFRGDGRLRAAGASHCWQRLHHRCPVRCCVGCAGWPLPRRRRCRRYHCASSRRLQGRLPCCPRRCCRPLLASEAPPGGAPLWCPPWRRCSSGCAASGGSHACPRSGVSPHGCQLTLHRRRRGDGPPTGCRRRRHPRS